MILRYQFIVDIRSEYKCGLMANLTGKNIVTSNLEFLCNISLQKDLNDSLLNVYFECKLIID